MQCIRLPKAIDIAERVLPELAAGGVDTLTVKCVNIIVLQQLQGNILVY
jgi:hypothetical protein